MPVHPHAHAPGWLLSLAPLQGETLIGAAGVRHGFFGRPGGVSTGIYAGLNAGPGSNDDPKAVAENRARIARWFGAPPDHLLSAHQVHSPLAMAVSGPWKCARPHVDALVTATPGLVVSVLTADCAPILFADTEASVVAAAHAGWKGTFGGVIEATLQTMESLGARRTRIRAAIGPTIAQASYEVGPEFVALLIAASPDNARFFAPGMGDRSHFDLPAYCVSRLQQSGVNRVTDARVDTFSAVERCFSHRRSVRESLGDYGRNCAAIMIKPR